MVSSCRSSYQHGNQHLPEFPVFNYGFRLSFFPWWTRKELQYREHLDSPADIHPASYLSMLDSCCRALWQWSSLCLGFLLSKQWAWDQRERSGLWGQAQVVLQGGSGQSELLGLGTLGQFSSDELDIATYPLYRQWTQHFAGHIITAYVI